jgi:hypothetical protein
MAITKAKVGENGFQLYNFEFGDASFPKTRFSIYKCLIGTTVPHEANI